MAVLRSIIKIKPGDIEFVFEESEVDIVSYITANGTRTQNKVLAANFGHDSDRSIADTYLFMKQKFPEYRQNNKEKWVYGNEEIDVEFWF